MCRRSSNQIENLIGAVDQKNDKNKNAITLRSTSNPWISLSME